jgi:hypothetical protein
MIIFNYSYTNNIISATLPPSKEVATYDILNMQFWLPIINFLWVPNTANHTVIHNINYGEELNNYQELYNHICMHENH